MRNKKWSMKLTLCIKQPSLSAIENRGNDLKISTMKKYVEAMGGNSALM